MTNAELKPCPFCGGANVKSGGDDKFVGAWCLNCGCVGPNHYDCRFDWNARADLSPSAKPLEWQPIETAPKDGTRFWAYEKGAGPDCYECWWQNDFGEWEGWQTDWDNEPDPTHWRPAITPDGPSDQPTPSDKDKEIERLRTFITEISETEWQEVEPAFGYLTEGGEAYVQEMESFCNWVLEKARAVLEERG